MAKKPIKPAVPDESLFETAMRDVEALKKKPAPAPAAAPQDKARDKPDPPLTLKPKPKPKPRPAIRPSPAPAQRLAPLNPGRSGDVDTRTIERLWRGQLRPEARLDLHGMTQAEAHRALEAFIPRARDAGRRCVIVITGKGSVSAGGGVLRNAVPGWLNSPSLRPSVLAYSEAIPRDGGGGALYVLLRRARG
jgi:DNA-nicking Smr family endonuclease